MGRFRDSADRLIGAVLVGGQGEPAGARRVTQVASVAARAAADGGHTALAVTVAVIGSAVVATEAVLTGGAVPPEGGYAGFTAEAPKRGSRR
ncbi:hypothetical protein OG689_28430 [Kitasatospora sp. NBC_00240]|uniref:hypothetical protein n=1 Tax=Kitasatospora sp. NBC_00240 TaxID=2903567 RepID=UPI002255FA48|nr:hypothetical protein [Kitasatospora sp. NBC_00240]MCX5213147.1 hypothetical protein [Kitasatospora sp. NBC_00240]